LAARPGGPIALRYAPSKPSLSEAADLSHSATTLFLTEFLGFPVSLFILFLGLRKPHSAHQDLDADLTRSAGTRDIPLPNTVKGIAYTMYPVVDMKRARKFYEEDLGLRPEHDVGGKWIEYHLWDNCFAITTLAGESVKPSADAGGSVALEVQNVDDFVDQLRKKGIRIKVEPFSTRVCRMAVVVDPEGNGVTLHAKSPK